jgi:hypothetical protein
VVGEDVEVGDVQLARLQQRDRGRRRGCLETHREEHDVATRVLEVFGYAPEIYTDEDAAKRDVGMLMVWNVYPSNAGHNLPQLSHK